MLACRVRGILTCLTLQCACDFGLSLVFQGYVSRVEPVPQSNLELYGKQQTPPTTILSAAREYSARKMSLMSNVMFVL